MSKYTYTDSFDVFTNAGNGKCRKSDLMSARLSCCFASDAYHQFFQVATVVNYSTTTMDTEYGAVAIDHDEPPNIRITCGLCGHTRLLLANGDVEIEE